MAIHPPPTPILPRPLFSQNRSPTLLQSHNQSQPIPAQPVLSQRSAYSAQAAVATSLLIPTFHSILYTYSAFPRSKTPARLKAWEGHLCESYSLPPPPDLLLADAEGTANMQSRHELADSTVAARSRGWRCAHYLVEKGSAYWSSVKATAAEILLSTCSRDRDLLGHCL